MVDSTRRGRIELSLDNARQKCQKELIESLREGEDVIYSALMSMGKSRGAVFAARKTGIPITVLTGRGHKEQYGQFSEWCEKFGLSYKRIPSFTNDCPSSSRQDAKDLYNRGVKPADIHRFLELPCGEACEYLQLWNFDPDDYDVLIGHYNHAFMSSMIENRAVFIDEFPSDSYEESFDEAALPRIITPYLKWAELPYKDFYELMENRQEEHVELFDETIFDIPPEQLAENPSLDAKAPKVVYALLKSRKLDNGWESAAFSRFSITGEPDDVLDSYNVASSLRSEDEKERKLYMLNPPDWSMARNVIGLDGLPTPVMWGSVFPSFEVQQVFSEGERRSYITDALKHRYILTTQARKPYSSRKSEIRDRVNVNYDAAVFEGTAQLTRKKPGLITTARAKTVYEEHGLLSLVEDVMHYGNLTGSNDFREVRVGVVSGSRHFGDGFVKKWGAYCGRSVERTGQNRELSYGKFGNKLYRHMTAHETLQAVMRFGRDGDGATVFVNTNTLPDWVPVHDTMKAETFSDGLRTVANVLEGVDEWQSTEDVWNAIPGESPGYRQVRNLLRNLHEMGLIDREKQGRGRVVRDSELANLPRYGSLYRANDCGN